MNLQFWAGARLISLFARMLSALSVMIAAVLL
jgi:hypothetical protein